MTAVHLEQNFASVDDPWNASQWLDREQYPFASRWFSSSAGRMHYVDEGEGETLLFVHGNPTWSFLYRHLIDDLRENYRCVAADHLGFGLSDKPESADYSPQALARNLNEFIEALDLRDITLVIHDWGGMIGMSCGLAAPTRIRRIVVFNSQFWSVGGVPAAERISRFFGSRLARFLCRRLNFFPRVVMPLAVGKRGVLTRAIRRHYLEPFPTPPTRMAPLRLGKAITGESAWLERLWLRRERLTSRPILVLWGRKDHAFGPEKLGRWLANFRASEYHVFGDVGHFVPEELGASAVPYVRKWLERNPLDVP